MPIWTDDNKPQDLTRAQKRNVIRTPKGWVRRQVYTDVHSNVRVKEETLIAIGDLSETAGFPTVTDIWHSANSVANGTIVNTYVSFNEPIVYGVNAGRLKITVANTVSGNNMFAYGNTSTVLVSNNTLLFRWLPDEVGDYKIQAQTIANGSATSANLRSLNTGGESANLIIGATASNNGATITITL